MPDILLTPGRDIILPRGFRREDYERGRIARAPFSFPPGKRIITPLQAAITLGAALVQASLGGSTVTISAGTLTAGRSLVVGIRWYSAAATISSVTCTSESNLTVHGSPQTNVLIVDGAGVSANIQFASLANITTTGAKTVVVNFSASPTDAGAFTQELVGANTSTLFDTDAGANQAGVGSTNPTVSLITGFDNCAIFSVVIDNNSVPTAGSGYTQITLSNDVWQEEGEYKLDAGTAGTNSVNFTAASSLWAIKAASFRPAAGAASSRDIFIAPSLNGLGAGGSFFHNRLG